MRLFLAIYPDENLAALCRDVYRHFDEEKRNLKAIVPEQLHITLRFVGAKVSDFSKNELAKALKEGLYGMELPEIAITNVQFGFERQHDPRVLFANVKENRELEELRTRINQIIRKLDFEDTITWKNNRDKRLHISIARFKPAATRSSGKKVKELVKSMTVPMPEPFLVKELAMVQSIIESTGKVKYRIIDRIPLR